MSLSAFGFQLTPAVKAFWFLASFCAFSAAVSWIGCKFVKIFPLKESDPIAGFVHDAVHADFQERKYNIAIASLFAVCGIIAYLYKV